ncbi:MAG: hypothetical protein KDA84_18100, partial [Planctomycetaceae bacterium]|nr:hypothetical protein [Planctomycetaceae bacterium]
MSYGIHAYAVSLDQLQSVIGKRRTGFFQRLFGASNDQLLSNLKQRYSDRLEEDAEDVDEDDEEEPTLERALIDLLEGNDLHPSYGHKYGYALEML